MAALTMPELEWRFNAGSFNVTGYMLWWLVVLTSVGSILNWFRRNQAG